jgi:hypothetical protein
MLRPIHGVWCNTRTWPTKCPTCGDSVFFFSCDCGCKVFFDELGPPWPIHDCDTSWTRNLLRTKDKTGKITVTIKPGITITRIPDSFTIEDNIVKKLAKKAFFSNDEPINAIKPSKNETKELVGILREINLTVDPLKTFKIENTQISYQLLGKIGKQPVGKITVHIPSNIYLFIESYTAWIPYDIIKDTRIKKGVTVSVSLLSETILWNINEWFCDYFEIIG